MGNTKKREIMRREIGAAGLLAIPPIKVRLNRSLFPADLLTLSLPGGVNSLQGVQYSWTTADLTLKSRSGDGNDRVDLSVESCIDVFVHSGRAAQLELPALRFAEVRSVRPGEPLVLKLTWTGVNGRERPGQAIVVWSHEDREAGRRPLIAHGPKSGSLEDYIYKSEPVTGALLGVRLRRVKTMRRLDARQRYRRERKAGTMTVNTSQQHFFTSLSVRGFRGFREEAKLTLAQPNGSNGSGLTIVVGANNAGKSTVWEAFDALARKSKSDVSFSEGRRNRLTAAGVRIQLQRQDGRSYNVESRRPNTSETIGHWSPAGAVAASTLEIVAVPSRRQFQASFGKGGAVQRDWMSNGPDFSRSQLRDQFSARLFELHNDDKKKASFDELMEEVLGHSLDWSIDLAEGQHGSSYYVKVTTGEGINHSSEGLGDGIISLLFILNALYDSDPDTLLVIDEPELSLHPQFVRRLGRVLSRYAADRQIVIYTHSPLLVSWDDIAAGAEIARVHKVHGDSRIARADRDTVDEISKARRGWRNPHTLGVDANEALFLDDGVVVVEGQEDAVLLPRAFSLAGVPFNGSIFGWGSGGEDNVRRILALLRDLEFARVAAVMDNNVPNTVERMRSSFPNFLIVEIPAADIRDKRKEERREVTGLLDEKGKVLKAELVSPTKQVLSRVNSYLLTGEIAASIQAAGESSNRTSPASSTIGIP